MHDNHNMSTITTTVMLISSLAVGIWLYPTEASAMGPGTRIDGNLYDVEYGMPVRRCVLRGAASTGLGVEAISYAGGHFACEMYNQVDDVYSAGGWCSQWVVPGSPDPCVPDRGKNNTPILLDLDRNRFHLSAGPVEFDIDADGQPESLTWVSPDTHDAFLYLDRNGNGLVDDGSELFGDATLLHSGVPAQHGYEALAEFDLYENGGNGDGVLDSADAVFSLLMLWTDSNTDGVNEHHESQGISAAGVLSLNLDYQHSRRTDKHGNQFRYISDGKIEVKGRAKTLLTTDVFLRNLSQ